VNTIGLIKRAKIRNFMYIKHKIMDRVKQFFRWFKALGGTLPETEEAINDRYIYDPKPVTTFKRRAAEIKRKYNHQFKFRTVVVDNSVSSFPDISKLDFFRKDGR